MDLTDWLYEEYYEDNQEMNIVSGLNDLEVQSIDTLLRKYRKSYGSKDTFKKLKSIWDIIRRVSFSHVPVKYVVDKDDKPEIYLTDVCDIQVLYHYLDIDFYIGIVDIVDWYRDNYMSLTKDEYSRFLDFLVKERKELGIEYLRYADLDAVSTYCDIRQIVQSCIVDEDYNGGIIILQLKSNEIYYEVQNKAYKLLFKQSLTVFDAYDIFYYYFKKFDLLIFQSLDGTSIIRDGNFLLNELDIKIERTNKNLKRLLLLSNDYYDLTYRG